MAKWSGGTGMHTSAGGGEGLSNKLKHPVTKSSSFTTGATGGTGGTPSGGQGAQRGHYSSSFETYINNLGGGPAPAREKKMEPVKVTVGSSQIDKSLDKQAKKDLQKAKMSLAQAKELVRLMEGVLEGKDESGVPIKVEVKTGANWQEMTPWSKGE